jgi:hypothetical protein
MPQLRLQTLAGDFSIVRLPAGSAVPPWAAGGPFVSITATDEELSIVCGSGTVPREAQGEHGWKALKVAGPLDFSLTGILAAIAAPLAAAEVSIFAVSTFDTDYVLVREGQLGTAVAVLREAGMEVEG